MPTFTHLTHGSQSTSTSPAVTASVSPAANRLLLLSVHAYRASGSIAPPEPVVNGNGLTWDVIETQDVDTSGADRATMWVFRAMGASPNPGSISINFGGIVSVKTAWSLEQSSADVDTSGTNGSGAIVQVNGVTTAGTATSVTVPFPAAMTAGNAAYGAFSSQATQQKTPRSGWTELADEFSVTVISLETQYLNGTDTDGSATWTTAARAGGIVVEVAAAPATTDKSGTETATGSDVVSLRAASITETAPVSDVVLSFAVAITASDTGSGTDTVQTLNQGGTSKSDVDTGSGTDAPQSLARSGPGDPGTGTDAVASTARTGPGDTAAGTDTASLAAAGAANDSGNALDAPVSLARAGVGDLGAGSDAVASTGRAGPADQMSATETVTLLVQISAADVATALDAVSAMAKLASESGTATDAVASLSGGTNPTSADTATATEGSSLSTSQSRTENAGATDAASLLASGQRPETAAITESAVLAATVTSTQAVSATETQALVATLLRTEQAVITENQTLTVFLTASEVVAVIDVISETSGPPTVRDWNAVSAITQVHGIDGHGSTGSVLHEATVHLTDGREAIVRITRLEG